MDEHVDEPINEADLVESYIAELSESRVLKEEELGSIREAKQQGGKIEEQFADDHQTDSSNIRAQIGKMTIPEKIKLALFGNGACRGLLAIDPNRVVHMAVMKNPKIRPPELEELAKNPNCPEGVLRAIAGNPLWMKNYKTKVNLVINPKTPSDISLKWLRYLNTDDLKRIARSKNLPQLVAVTAKKKLSEEQ